MKKINFYYLILVTLFACLGLSSCSKDDDSGLSGYYIMADVQSNVASDLSGHDPDGFIIGFEGWKFDGNDVVERMLFSYYLGNKSGAIGTINVNGNTVSIVPKLENKYTYVVSGSAIVISSGETGTISGNELYLDGWSQHWEKY